MNEEMIEKGFVEENEGRGKNEEYQDMKEYTDISAYAELGADGGYPSDDELDIFENVKPRSTFDPVAAESIGIGKAPGKAILIGEHGVVHGTSAIALPLLGIGVQAKVSTEAPGTIMGNLYSGPLNRAPRRFRPLLSTLQLASDYCENFMPEDVGLTLRSTVPPERGLGSSAAVATAIVRACAQFAQVELTQDEMYTIVQAAEEIAHMNPSGVDARAVSSNEPIRFRQGVYTEVRVGRTMFLVIADTGLPRRTREAIQHVQSVARRNPRAFQSDIDYLGRLVRDAEHALNIGDAKSLGATLNESHEMLRSFNVSCRELDTLVLQARQSGALGAKLTGAGLGGCMIALTTSPQEARAVATALRQTGAVYTCISQIAATPEATIRRQDQERAALAANIPIANILPNGFRLR